MRVRFWFSAAAVLVFSCGAVQAAETAGRFTPNRIGIADPDLMAAVRDIKKTLSAPRTPLSFENGAAAQNCAGYSNLLSTSPPAESVRNAEIRGEYLVCDSIRLIASEPFVAEKGKVPAGAAQALFERLDLRSFPSSLRNRADDQKHTLKTLLVAGQVRLTGDAVRVETETQSFSLKIVAVVKHAGVDKDGKEPGGDDWIVWVGDEMKDGNYKSYRTLVVRPPDPGTGGRYTGSMHPPR